MPSNARFARLERMRAKAEALFIMYYNLAGDRSLARLYELCGMATVKVSPRTLETYSTKYNWQRRILELDQHIDEERERKQIEAVEEMNRRHASVARGILGVAFAGLKNFNNRIQRSKDNTIPMSATTLATLYRTAQSGERLALGQATSKVEVWLDVVQTVINEFGLIFMTVNEIEKKEDRQREYVRLADDMIKRYLEQNKIQLDEGQNEIS